MKRIICPCYDPAPGPEWEVMFDHADDIAFAILNVNSGVGVGIDPVYVAMATRLQAAGIKRLGYVSTRYGNRPIEEVKREIEKWFAFYSVDGIFADEQASEAGLLPYYRRVKSACGTAQLVTNPGAIPSKEYADLDAIICCAETYQQTYLNKMFPGWIMALPETRFLHMVFSVTDAKRVMDAINRNNARYIYLTTAKPAPGASGPEFNIPETIWPQLSAPTPVPQTPTGTLFTCTNVELLAEVKRRMDL
jgi:hypothetical protein